MKILPVPGTSLFAVHEGDEQVSPGMFVSKDEAKEWIAAQDEPAPEVPAPPTKHAVVAIDPSTRTFGYRVVSSDTGKTLRRHSGNHGSMAEAAAAAEEAGFVVELEPVAVI